MTPIPAWRVACLFAAWLTLTACTGPDGDRVTLGGPFHMVDQDARPRDESMMQGKWSAVFFGYTFCPDVCPTTLQALGDAQDKLGPKAARFQVVFVSVDPARDTPGQLKTYLSSPAFPKGTIGLTGTPAQVAAMAKAYKVFYQPEGAGPGYSVQHTSVVYLMDSQGRFDRPIAYGVAPEEIARQVSDAMNR